MAKPRATKSGAAKARTAKSHAAKRGAAKLAPAKSARSPSLVDAEIGVLIRARRQERNVSQTQLADDLGITFQQVQKYEKGINRVAASTLIRIARALGCKVTDLLPRELV